MFAKLQNGKCDAKNLPRDAICKAVFPFLVAASTIAPLFTSSRTISM